ncbi:MAG: hypothetical protein FWF11_01240 [Coriobacteriia bacterium]|nr:hypothetical protein [Coriobacteriia bacterium]
MTQVISELISITGLFMMFMFFVYPVLFGLWTLFYRVFLEPADEKAERLERKRIERENYDPSSGIGDIPGGRSGDGGGF